MRWVRGQVLRHDPTPHAAIARSVRDRALEIDLGEHRILARRVMSSRPVHFLQGESPRFSAAARPRPGKRMMRSRSMVRRCRVGKLSSTDSARPSIPRGGEEVSSRSGGDPLEGRRDASRSSGLERSPPAVADLAVDQLSSIRARISGTLRDRCAGFPLASRSPAEARPREACRDMEEFSSIWRFTPVTGATARRRDPRGAGDAAAFHAARSVKITSGSPSGVRRRAWSSMALLTPRPVAVLSGPPRGRGAQVSSTVLRSSVPSAAWVTSSPCALLVHSWSSRTSGWRAALFAWSSSPFVQALAWFFPYKPARVFRRFTSAIT